MTELAYAAGYVALFITLGLTICGFALCTWAGTRDWDTSYDEDGTP